MSLIETLFISTFSVARRTRASNGQGGWIESWPVMVSIEGRMRPASATEQVAAQQRQAKISHVLYVAGAADVLRADRVSGESRLWDVIAVREPSHAGHHLEIDCLEIQREGQP